MRKKRILLISILCLLVLMYLNVDERTVNKTTGEDTSNPFVVPLERDHPELEGNFFLSEEGMWKRYDKSGTTMYDPNSDVYHYSTKAGLTNHWNGTNYQPYIWDAEQRHVYYAGHRMEFNDWYSVLRNASDLSNTIIDESSWVCEYWDLTQEAWRVLDLHQTSFIAPVLNEYNMTFGQSYTDGFSVMNVTYKFRNYNDVKIQIDFYAETEARYRFVWKNSGVDTEALFLTNGNNQTIGVDFSNGTESEIQFRWDDELKSDLDIWWEWLEESKKFNVYFGNRTVGAGETFVVDPSVSPNVSSDSWDDDWERTGAAWTHRTGYDDNTIEAGGTSWYAQAAFNLAIPQYATIISATLKGYNKAGGGAGSATISVVRLVDATEDLGPLESDTTQPGTDTTPTDTLVYDNTAEWKTHNTYIDDMLQEQVNKAGWVSGYDMGFRASNNGALTRWWEDYQSSGTNEGELDATYSMAPVNAETPNLDNPTDTDNMYAQYTQYNITLNVTDADGNADFNYVEIGLWDNTQTTEYWRGRIDESSGVFSEQYDGGTYVELNTTRSKYWKGGNWLNATFVITIDWDFPDATDIDVKQYVLDDSAVSDTDWYEVNWDIETRLDYTTAPYVSDDDAGTVDRGDLDETFTMTGTLEYYGSASDARPPDDGVDVWIAASEYGTNVGPWSDLTLASGVFSITCYADNEFGQDTYTAKPVIEAAGSGGTTLYYTTDLTDTYIADTISIQMWVSDARDNIGDVVGMTAWLTHMYDATNVTSGTVTFSSGAGTYQSGGEWMDWINEATVGMYPHNITAVSSQHGVTTISMVEFDDAGTTWIDFEGTAVFDTPEYMTVAAWVSWSALPSGGAISTIVEKGNQASNDAWIFGLYDSAGTPKLYWELGNGTTRNTVGLTSPDTSWTPTLNQWYHIVGTYDTSNGWARIYVNGALFAEENFGFTVIGTNILSLDVGIYRGSSHNLDGYIQDVRLYNRTLSSSEIALLYSGEITFNNDADLLLWLPATTFDLADSTWYDNSDNSNDGTIVACVPIAFIGNYSVRPIFDEIEVFYGTVQDARADIGDTEWPYFRLRLKYDNHLLDDGSNDYVNINGATATWSGVGETGGWYRNYLFSYVLNQTFAVTSAGELTYGIDTLDASTATYYTQAIIWDAIGIYMWLDDGRDDIDDTITVYAWLTYIYDSTNVTDGSVALNGSAMSYASNIWSLGVSQSSVGLWAYNITSISGNTYGITVVGDIGFNTVGEASVVLGDVIRNPAALTVSAWFRGTDLTDWATIVSRGHQGLDDEMWLFYRAGKLFFEMGNGTTVFAVSADFTPSLEWNFVTGVADSSGNLLLYINGIWEATYEWSLYGGWDTYSDDTDPLTIGDSSYGYSGGPWNGSIGSVRIYERALGAVEIFELYQNRYSDDSNLIVNYQRSSYDVLANIWYDLSGNGYDMTLYGTPTVNQSIYFFYSRPIWDRVLITYFEFDDYRVSVDANTEVRVKAELEYDGTTLGSGDSIQVNSTALSWDAGNSWFDYSSFTQSTVGRWFFNVTSVNEAGFVITEFRFATGVKPDWSNTYATAPLGEMTGDANFTVTAWIRWENDIWTNSTAFFGTRAADDGWMFYRNTGWGSGDLGFLIAYNKTDASKAYVIPNWNGFETWTWYHITGIAWANGSASLYVNGELKVTEDAVDFYEWNYGDETGFSCPYYYVSDEMGSAATGALRYYNVSLSSLEILSDMYGIYATDYLEASYAFNGDLTDSIWGNDLVVTGVDDDVWNQDAQYVVWDKIYITTTAINDQRDDIGDGIIFSNKFFLEYDDYSLQWTGAGTFNLDGGNMVYASGTQVWYRTITYNYVTNETISFVSVLDATFSVNVFTNSSWATWAIWDAVSWEIFVSDDRVDIDATVTVYVRARYAFDYTPFQASDGSTMTTNQAGSLSDTGGGYWQGTFSTGSVEMLNEFITAFSDGLYGLTANTTGIQFDAGTQYMWGADRDEYDTTTLTLAVWFYPTKVSGAQFMIARYSDRYHFAIYIESNNVARLYYSNPGGGTVFVDVLDGATFTLNTWTHLVITVDGTTYNSWLNGVHVVDDGVMANVLQGGTAAIIIGQRDAGTLGTWDYEGYISDFFLYNIALTDLQCQALYSRDDISTNRVLKHTGFGHLANSVYENAVWYDNSGNNYHLYGYNGVSIEAGVSGARYTRPIFDRMILNATPNYDWTLLDHNITLLASGIYDYDDTAWSGVATFNTTTYPTYGTVGIYYFNISSATDTNYGLTVLTSDVTSAVWDNITVDSSYYYVQEMPTGDKFFTILFSQLKWQYNDSYIGADWICENIRTTTVTSTATTDANSYLYPYQQLVPVLAGSSEIEYHNNATKTIGSRSFDIQWYSVTASTAAALDIQVEHVSNLVTTIAVSGSNNVGFNWTIYNEGVASGESGEITGTDFEIEFNKVMSDGLHNYSIYFNASASGSRWFNSSYNVDFDINIDPPEVKGDNVEVRGTTNLDCNYYVYSEGVYTDETGSLSPETFSFFFTKQTVTGLHNYSLYFNVTGSYIWKNGSYYVSAPSAYDSHIVILNNLYELVPFDTFEVYVNDTRIYHDLIQVTDGYAYNVTVKNRFGDTVNSTMFAADFEMVIFVNTYSFKFMNWYNGFLRVNVTRAGLTYSEIIMPLEIIEFNLFQETYTFTVDFLNGTTKFSQEITVTNSTGYVITGDSLTDVFDLVNSVYAMTNQINVTVTTTSNNVITISLDLENVNSTIFSQTVNILTNITNSNSTIYDQTVTLISQLTNVNSSIFAQTVSILADIQNVNSTLYDQTVSILTNISSVNSTLYAQTVTMLTNLENVNSTLYAQTVTMLTNLQNVNSTIYTQTLSILSQITNVNSTIYSQTLSILSNLAELNATIFLTMDPTVLGFQVVGHQFSDLYCDFTVVTNFHNTTLTVYENNLPVSSPTAEGPTLRYTLTTADGTYNLSLYVDSGSQQIWYNISYTVVATVYATSHIYTYDQGGTYVDWEQFIFLVNGTQIVGNEFYNRTDYSYQIIVQDRFGVTLSSASYSFARSIRITMTIHTFMVHNMMDDQFIYFNLSRQAGGTWSRHITPKGHLLYELFDDASYSYTYTSISNDGTVRTHEGTLRITTDMALVIVDIGLDYVLDEVRLISPGGGVGKEYVEGRFDELSTSLSFMWTFLWGFGIVMVLLIWVAPYLSSRGERSAYDDTGRTSKKKKPKKKKPAEQTGASGGHVFRTRGGAERADKDAEFGPRK